MSRNRRRFLHKNEMSQKNDSLNRRCGHLSLWAAKWSASGRVPKQSAAQNELWRADRAIRKRGTRSGGLLVSGIILRLAASESRALLGWPFFSGFATCPDSLIGKLIRTLKKIRESFWVVSWSVNVRMAQVWQSKLLLLMSFPQRWALQKKRSARRPALHYSVFMIGVEQLLGRSFSKQPEASPGTSC